jgi:histidinol phosphatase-like PHP family hydrolase
MKIDIHTHCIEGNIKVEEILKVLKKYSIDGICITEHTVYYKNNPLWGKISKMVDEINKTGCFLAIPGLEILTEFGEFLVFGDISEKDIYVPSKYGWDISSFFENFKREENVIIWAHPARKNIGLDEKLKNIILKNIDGIEIFNGNHQRYRKEYDEKVENILNGFQKEFAKCGGSDAHSIITLGDCYTEFEEKIRNVEEFVNSLKQKKVRAFTHPKIKEINL